MVRTLCEFKNLDFADIDFNQLDCCLNINVDVIVLNTIILKKKKKNQKENY